MTKVRTALPLASATNGGDPVAGAAGPGAPKKSPPHWDARGGASRKTAIGPFGAIREIEIVSGWPGVTNPSETTLAFRKTNFVCCLPFEARLTTGGPAAMAGTTSTHARAVTTTAAVRDPLPADTGVTIAGESRHGKRRAHPSPWAC